MTEAKTLREAEEQISKIITHEEGYITDQDGDVIKHIIGERSSVSPPPELVKDNIFTHNHPSGMCALSLGDVKAIISYDGLEVRAVTFAGKYASLKRGNTGWNPKLGEDMEKAGFTDLQLLLRANLEATKKYGKDKTARHVNQMAEIITNTWLRENVSKYGAEFKEGTI
jgi:hypothetical protein